MNRLHALAASLALLSTATACSSTSSSTGAPVDSGAADTEVCGDAGYACGQPCDPGNSIGVGYFCNTISDCEVTPQAHLCATLGDPSEHFCTFVCDGTMDGGDQCGENAICQCQGGQCGCFPTYCLGN